jgi:acyl-CoA dehydrogenase
MYATLPTARHYCTPEHDAFRTSVRRFVEHEILPHINDWDEAETFPRDLYRKAGELGLLGLSFPEAWGGTPGDVFYNMVLVEEMTRCASGGLLASLFSHSIGAPPIVTGGSEELKAAVLPAILRGEKISALAITEPGGGSDVSNLQLKAVRDGDFYVLNGEKTFITSGMRADYITVAVRTGGPGAEGVSALLVPGDTPGLQRTSLKKMGWWCSDTAHLRFEDCRVPVSHLLGQENQGFLVFMQNFNQERLSLALQAYGFAKVCLNEASEWASQRTTFGKRLVGHQVVRHKLVAMATQIEATRCMIEDLSWRVGAGEMPIPQICMVKNFAAQTLQTCADEAVQILGGMGFMRGTQSERIYREVKVNMIGGGAHEVLTELAARQLGWA